MRSNIQKPLTNQDLAGTMEVLMREAPTQGDPQVAHELYRLTEAVLLLTRVVFELPLQLRE